MLQRLTLRRRVIALIVVAFVAVVAVVAVRVSDSRADPRGLTVLAATPVGPLAVVPAFSHAYVIVLENKSFDGVFGAPLEAPTFARLRAMYASLESHQGIAHPSQPNYVAMVAGSTLGITDNESRDVDSPSIFDQVEATGRDWRVYAENVPMDCFTGATATDGRDGEGEYVRKHNPAISFVSINRDPARCARIQDFSSLDPTVADLAFFIPNMCHGSHDCPLATADAWLAGFLPALMASAAYRDGGVIFVLFEESDGTPENHVPALVISQDVTPGSKSTVPHSHYSLLRTLQEAWSLPCLAASCGANTVGEVFKD